MILTNKDKSITEPLINDDESTKQGIRKRVERQSNNEATKQIINHVNFNSFRS